jgi:hypothetical protein
MFLWMFVWMYICTVLTFDDDLFFILVTLQRRKMTRNFGISYLLCMQSHW